MTKPNPLSEVLSTIIFPVCLCANAMKIRACVCTCIYMILCHLAEVFTFTRMRCHFTHLIIRFHRYPLWLIMQQPNTPKWYRFAFNYLPLFSQFHYISFCLKEKKLKQSHCRIYAFYCACEKWGSSYKVSKWKCW